MKKKVMKNEDYEDKAGKMAIDPWLQEVNIDVFRNATTRESLRRIEKLSGKNEDDSTLWNWHDMS